MTGRTAAVTQVDELRMALADDGAFESWYRRTVPRVYAYLLSRCGGDAAIAEDLTQQTFIAAIDRRWQFDGRSDVVTWLCGIARHKLADHFRTVEREEQRQLRMQVRQIEVDDTRESGDAVEDRSLIADVMRSLPASQRAVLVFVVLDDLPVREAARLLGRSRSATESLLFRARESFRRAYGERNEP